MACRTQSASKEWRWRWPELGSPQLVSKLDGSADAHKVFGDLLQRAKKLHQEGNEFYHSDKYHDAASKYISARVLLGQIPTAKGGARHLHCLVNLMGCCLVMGDYHKCIDLGSEVLEYDSKNLAVFLYQGQAYRELGFHEEAYSAMRKVYGDSSDEDGGVEEHEKEDEQVYRQEEMAAQEHEEYGEEDEIAIKEQGCNHEGRKTAPDQDVGEETQEVSVMADKLSKVHLIDLQSVIFTDTSLKNTIEYDACHHHHKPPIPFTNSEVQGLFGNVYDIEGEELPTGIIAYISNICVDYRLELHEEGLVVHSEDKGMTPINDRKPRRIINSRPYSFLIEEDTTNFGGQARGESEEFILSNFSRYDRWPWLHLAFQILVEFQHIDFDPGKNMYRSSSWLLNGSKELVGLRKYIGLLVKELVHADFIWSQSHRNHFLKVLLFSTLLLDLRICISCNYGLQKKLLSTLADLVSTESSAVRDADTLHILLEGCRILESDPGEIGEIFSNEFNCTACTMFAKYKYFKGFLAIFSNNLVSGVPTEFPSACKTSLVYRISGGHLKNHVKSIQCYNCSNKLDLFLDLRLEFLEADSLRKALSRFTDIESKGYCHAQIPQISHLDSPFSGGNDSVLEMKDSMGLIGCYLHSDPGLPSSLANKEDSSQLSVFCGLLVMDTRSLFIYMIPFQNYRGNSHSFTSIMQHSDGASTTVSTVLDQVFWVGFEKLDGEENVLCYGNAENQFSDQVAGIAVADPYYELLRRFPQLVYMFYQQCNDKFGWQHIPWMVASAAKSSVRPLCQALQGIDSSTKANMFANIWCIGEKTIKEKVCFVLKVGVDPQALMARGEGPAKEVKPTPEAAISVLSEYCDSEADMGSAGAILYNLWRGVPSFWAKTKAGIFMSLQGSLDFESEQCALVSDNIKDLILSVQNQDPKERFTVHHVFCQPWIDNVGIASEKSLDSADLSRLKQFPAWSKLEKMAWRVTDEAMGYFVFDPGGNMVGSNRNTKLSTTEQLDWYSLTSRTMSIYEMYFNSDPIVYEAEGMYHVEYRAPKNSEDIRLEGLKNLMKETFHEFGFLLTDTKEVPPEIQHELLVGTMKHFCFDPGGGSITERSREALDSYMSSQFFTIVSRSYFSCNDQGRCLAVCRLLVKGNVFLGLEDKVNLRGRVCKRPDDLCMRSEELELGTEVS